MFSLLAYPNATVSGNFELDLAEVVAFSEVIADFFSLVVDFFIDNLEEVADKYKNNPKTHEKILKQK